MSNSEVDAAQTPADSELPEDAVAQLAAMVGRDLLAFLIALSPRDLVDDRLPVDEGKRAVFKEVWAAATAHSTERQGARWEYRWRPLRSDQILQVFCSYEATLNSTLATHFHVRAGGARPRIEETDSVAAGLQTVAIDCFAARLIGEPGQSLLPTSTRSHPAMESLRDAMSESSEPVSAIFRPDSGPAHSPSRKSGRGGLAHQVEVHWSTGDGGSLLRQDLANNLLVSVVLEKDLDDTVLERVAASMLKNLDRARRLSAGETVAVTTLVGLGDVALADDTDAVEIPGGVLRRPTVLDRRANSFAAEPTLILQVEQDLVYNELSAPSAWNGTADRQERLREFVADNERRKKFVPAMVEAAEGLQELIRGVRCAMVLASPADSVLKPTWLFTRQYNPLTGHGSNSHKAHDRNLVRCDRPPTLTSAMSAEISRWALMMSELPDSLKIGQRRLLQAATEERDVFDRFIDAVVAWESMFGSKTEAMFRVTGSMAVLLEPSDLEARRTLHKKLTMLYGHRSDLVHGAVGHDKQTKDFKVVEVPSYTAEALRFAIECFKLVLNDSDLRPLEAAARGKRVLLGI